MNISVRNLHKEDIDFICDYWHRSPEGFLENMGIIPQNIASEEKIRRYFESIIGDQTPFVEKIDHHLTVTVDNQPVGMHPLTFVKYGQSGIMHAHIWLPEFRKKGIGSHSYVHAMRFYFDAFNLQSIKFDTPVINAGPNRLKEKLGIEVIGESILESHPILRPGIKIIHYEMTRERFNEKFNI